MLAALIDDDDGGIGPFVPQKRSGQPDSCAQREEQNDRFIITEQPGQKLLYRPVEDSKPPVLSLQPAAVFGIAEDSGAFQKLPSLRASRVPFRVMATAA